MICEILFKSTIPVILFLSSRFTSLPEILRQRLPVRIYTMVGGLWSSAINYLIHDWHGSIWLCTRDRLSCSAASPRFSLFLRLLRLGAAFITLVLVPGAA